MGKDEYRKALDRLPRGAKAELARKLKVPGYHIAKMFRSKRPLRHEEAVVIDQFLADRQAMDLDRPKHHSNVTVQVRETRQVDAAMSETVPLWGVVEVRHGAGGLMNIAQTVDTVPAPAGLKHLQIALSIDVWDDINSPQLPRGTTLYILRSTGRDGIWHVFGMPVGKGQSGMQNPMLGILLGQTDATWRVRVGDKEVDLPRADYPAAWQVRQIHY